MKLPFFPDNPGSLYLVALINALSSALILVEMGSYYPASVTTVLFSGIGLGLSIGLLFRYYYVWIAAVVTVVLACLLTGLRFVKILTSLADNVDGSLPIMVIIAAAPLLINLFVLYYLNSDSIRPLFGLTPLHEKQ